MGDPYSKLLAAFKQPMAPAGMVFGHVDRWPDAEHPDAPRLVTVEGLQRASVSLLKDARHGPYDFIAGDTLLMVPIDERQRFVILCKVVSV